MSKFTNSFGNVQQSQWDGRAAANFMFAGSGAALMLMLAITSLQAVPLRPAGLLALALLGVGLLCVWLEIGRPWRFLHVFFHPQTSWMTREASVAVVLFAIAIPGLIWQLPAAIAVAGVLGLVFLCCQGFILRASRGIVAWREPMVVPLIVLTGLAEGAALLLILLIFTDQENNGLLYALISLSILRLINWFKYRHRLAAGKAPIKAINALEDISRPYVISANLIPLLLLLFIALFPAYTKPLGLVASLLVLLGGWLMKHTLITRAAQVQGYALGKLHKGRPKIKPPVRRATDRFVFDRRYDRLTQK